MPITPKTGSLFHADSQRYLPALANAEQCVRLALKRTDVQPIPRKIWPGGFVSGGGR